MAIVHFRCPDQRATVNRVVNILEERRVYSGNACSRWRKILHAPPPAASGLAKVTPLPSDAVAAMQGGGHQPATRPGSPGPSSASVSSSKPEGADAPLPGAAGLPERPPAGPRVDAATLREVLEDAAFRQRVTVAVAGRVRYLNSDTVKGSEDVGRLLAMPRLQRQAEATDALRACAVLQRLRFCAEETSDANHCLAARLRKESAKAADLSGRAAAELKEVESLIARMEAARYMATGAAVEGASATGTVVAVDKSAVDGSSDAVDDMLPLEADTADAEWLQDALSPSSLGGGGAMRMLSGVSASDTDLLGNPDEDEDAAADEEAAAKRAAKREREDEAPEMVYNPIAREYQPRAELHGEDWRD